MKTALEGPAPPWKDLHCEDFWVEIPDSLLRESVIWHDRALALSLLRHDSRTWKLVPIEFQIDPQFFADLADASFASAARILENFGETSSIDMAAILDESLRKRPFPDCTPQTKSYWGHPEYFRQKMYIAKETLRRFPERFLDLPDELRYYPEFVMAASCKAPPDLLHTLQAYKVADERPWRHRYLHRHGAASQYITDFS